MTNTVVVSGNLVKDPVKRGDKMITFSIAYNESVKNQNGEYVKRPSFFNVVRFASENGINYLLKNMGKGDKVTVSGMLRQNSWEYNGKTFYDVQIVASGIELSFNRNGGGNNGNGGAANQGGDPYDVPEDPADSYYDTPPMSIYEDDPMNDPY